MNWKDMLDPWKTTQAQDTAPVGNVPGAEDSPWNTPDDQIGSHSARVLNPVIAESFAGRSKPMFYRRLRWIGDISDSRQAPAVASGTTFVAELSFGPIPTQERWRIDRLAIQTFGTDSVLSGLPETFTPQPNVFVYGGSTAPGSNQPFLPSDLIDGSPTGHFAVSSSGSPIMLGQNQYLRIVWTGLQTQSQVSCRLHADRYILEEVPLGTAVPSGPIN